MWDWFQIIIIGLLVLIIIQIEIVGAAILKRQPQADQQDITREKLREDILNKLDSINYRLSDIASNRLLLLIHDELEAIKRWVSNIDDRIASK